MRGGVMLQDSLFGESLALQVWRLAPPCCFGSPTLAGTARAPGWNGAHQCLGCWVEVERACLACKAYVAAGIDDAQGYRQGDRKKRRHAEKESRTALAMM